MSFDGYMQIIFTTIIPAIIAIVVEIIHGDQRAKKKYIIISIGIWALVLITASFTYFFSKQNNNEISDDESVAMERIIDSGNQLQVFTKGGENNGNETNSTKDKKEEMKQVASENTNDESKEQVLFDVNAEVLNIQEKYYSLPKPASLSEPTSSDPIFAYQDVNSMTIIKVYHGYGDVKYSRFYYFDEDGKLYFAFIFDKLKENRLYFKDDTIIRYIDEAGITYDLYNNLDTCEWEEFTIKESYEIFNNLNQ